MGIFHGDISENGKTAHFASGKNFKAVCDTGIHTCQLQGFMTLVYGNVFYRVDKFFQLGQMFHCPKAVFIFGWSGQLKFGELFQAL